MAKNGFIMMLVVAQLLIGVVGQRFVCLKHDGSFCCVDHGSVGCKCCHHEEKAEEACHCHHDEEPTSDMQCCAIQRETSAESCDCHSTEMVTESNETQNEPCLTENSSGCKHVPIAANPTVSSPRMVIADNLVVANSWLCMPPHCDEASTTSHYSQTVHGPPRAVNLSLILISSVMLRC